MEKKQYIQVLECPAFNPHIFILCSLAHLIRLYTDTISPFIAIFLFMFEYGLLSSFITYKDEPVIVQQQRVYTNHNCNNTHCCDTDMDMDTDTDTDTGTDEDEEALDNISNILKKK